MVRATRPQSWNDWPVFARPRLAGFDVSPEATVTCFPPALANLELALACGHTTDLHQAAFLKAHLPHAMRDDEPYKTTVDDLSLRRGGESQALATVAAALAEACDDSEMSHSNRMPEPRRGGPADLDAVLALNQASLPHLGELTSQKLARLVEIASCFLVVERDAALAGFVLAMTPEAPYDSINFGWFKARYPSFVYVDRIAIAPSAARAGFGNALYREVVAHARAIGAPIVTCEINTRPPNPHSIAFHDHNGFIEVGSQDTEGGAKTVSMRVKHL